METSIKVAIATAKAKNRFVSDRELKAEEETLKQEQGNYTQERHVWLDGTSLQDILTLMRQHREDDPNRYDEIVE